MQWGAFGEFAFGDQVADVACAALLNVVDHQALYEGGVAGADVAASCADQGGGDLPVGAACAPAFGDVVGFCRQLSGTNLQGHLCGIVLPVDFIGLCLQRFGLLPLEVRFPRLVGEEGAGFVGECGDDLETGADFVFVEDRLERVAAVAITGHVAVEAGDGLLSGLAGAFLLFSVVGDAHGTAADTATRHAAGIVAGADGNRHVGADLVLVFRQLGAGGALAAGLHVAFLVLADFVVAATEADGVGVVIGLVLDVAAGEAGGDQAVLAVLHGLVAAGDHGADQVGVAPHVDVETVITGLDARLLGDTGVVGIDVCCAEVAAGTTDGAHAGAERRNAQADAEAEALFVDLVGVGVLQAFDIQIAANIGDNLFATRHRTLDLRIAARGQQ